MKYKICGIQTAQAAMAAYNAGATHIGINFIPSSPRFIRPSAIQSIVTAVHGRLKIVGVFQDMPLKVVSDICALYALDYAQLHGNESPEYCRQLNVPIIKTIAVSATSSLQDISTIMHVYTCYAFLLDREVQGQGSSVNLTLAKQLSQQFPCFLAGGLTPDTIAHAVRAVRPFGIDVASGIESNGIFDSAKVTQFIANAKEALV